jgi:iron complex outermembrane receptor protein
MPSVIMLDTPRHKIYGSATYTFNRLTLLADLSYEGGRWNANDAGRVLRAPSFANLGIGGSYRFFKQAELQAGIGNLLDRNYFLVQGYPEIGRNGYLNFRYRF